MVKGGLSLVAYCLRKVSRKPAIDCLRFSVTSDETAQEAKFSPRWRSIFASQIIANQCSIRSFNFLFIRSVDGQIDKCFPAGKAFNQFLKAHGGLPRRRFRKSIRLVLSSLTAFLHLDPRFDRSRFLLRMCQSIWKRLALRDI